MRKLIGLAVSLTILAIIYWQIDISALFAAFERTNIGWLVGALTLLIPVTLLGAWRLTVLSPSPLPFGESLRLILMASVLNMVLPSKMGDIAKAYAIAERGHSKGLPALSLVVFEKAWDLLSLLVFCVLGLALTWSGVVALRRACRHRRRRDGLGADPIVLVLGRQRRPAPHRAPGAGQDRQEVRRAGRAVGRYRRLFLVVAAPGGHGDRGRRC